MRQLGDVLTCVLNEGKVLNTDWRLIRTPEDWEAYLDTLEYDSLAIDPAEYPVFVHSHEAIDSREDPYMHHTFIKLWRRGDPCLQAWGGAPPSLPS